ncbi:hypothetical protein IAR55_004406 [Kwoniella newhampshirensis]|uniref:Zn(2)-C6 fungal-type domain-containing protein n=1 Tax=Kwoniella newhampshirensis TaxID=1651941 RepID=A0AAW0YX97_9TREE
MPDNALSFRPRHLPIQEEEERPTGRVIVPNDGRRGAGSGGENSGSAVTPSVSLSSSLPSTIHTPSPPIVSVMLSPPVSPSTFAFSPSPKRSNPSLSGEGQGGFGGNAAASSSSSRRPTSSIFSLLNDLKVDSPPSPSSASSHGSHRAIEVDTKTRSTSRPPYPPRSPRSPPHTAPITTHSQSMYFDERPFPSHHTNSSHLYPIPSPNGSARPALYRRHSSQPYEYSPSSAHSSRPTTAYATGPIYEPEYAAAMGGRAPISRTTKACNACRSRKVRCDAGGNNGSGELGTCSRCRESGVQCVYTGVQKKRGPCPGTARPSISKTRRSSAQSQTTPGSISSQRSSIASVQSYVITPTEEQSWNSRSSYGFPPPPPSTSHPTTIDPSEWSSVAPGKQPVSQPPSSSLGGQMSRPLTANVRRPSEHSVLSWPAMEPAQTQERDSGMFDRDYAISSRGRADRERDGRRMDTMDHQPHHQQQQQQYHYQTVLPPLRVAINSVGSYYDTP